MRTLTVNKKDLKHDLSDFVSGRIRDMEKFYCGKDALLIKSGRYMYKVTEDIYNFYS